MKRKKKSYRHNKRNFKIEETIQREKIYNMKKYIIEKTS